MNFISGLQNQTAEKKSQSTFRASRRERVKTENYQTVGVSSDFVKVWNRQRWKFVCWIWLLFLIKRAVHAVTADGFSRVCFLLMLFLGVREVDWSEHFQKKSTTFSIIFRKNCCSKRIRCHDPSRLR